MRPQKIKVGLLIDNFIVPAWIYESIKRIIESNYATMTLIVKNESSDERKIDLRNLQYLAYNLYRKIENKYHKLTPNAFSQKNISDVIKKIPILNVEPLLKRDGCSINEPDIYSISSYQLDVCIKFGFKNLQGDILRIPNFGVWTFGNSDNLDDTNLLAGVWEVIEDKCTTSITLNMLTESNEKKHILYQSFSSTHKTINKNQNLAYWKAVSFIPRKLKELYDTNGKNVWENINKLNNQTAHCNSTQPINAPSNIKFIHYLFKRYFKKIGEKLWNLSNHEKWILLYNFSKGIEFNKISSSGFHYKEIVPPKGKFWADPFVFYRGNGKYFIFFEEYVYKKKKAHISVMELVNAEKTSEPQIVLEKPYHLSYPFIFNDGEDIYMIPETCGNKTIEIYKCISFPDKWEFQMNLMQNIQAVDATICNYNNKYWLFVNIKENNGASIWDELFLFYSKELLTNNWYSHPQNPIVSDVRLARPAGRIFEHKGKLYRPSQDCSCSYGYATNINEIITLNEYEYSERKITTISPKWNNKVIGVHTFSYSNNLFVIDAKYKRKK